VLESFRSDATKLLAREFGKLIAAEAVRRLDLVAVGLEISDRKMNPIQDAYDRVSKTLLDGDGFSQIDCKISFYFVNDAVLATFDRGNDFYRKIWENRKEVFRWGWSDSQARPRGLSEQRWKTREIYWRAATTRPGIGAGLHFSLIDGKPPQLGWNGIRRFIPSLEQRVAAILPEVQRKSDGGRPKENLAEMRRKIATSIIRDLGKSHLFSYEPPARPSQKIRSITSQTRENTAVQQTVIEHADVVKSSDGRIFVAVPYVGLDTEDRVFLQVADNEIVITQNAKEYGHVGNVSRSAVDLLRECKTVTMVEVENSGGNRLLRAKHVAIVKDISLTENVSRLFGQWRQGKGKQSRSDGEIKLWDSQQ